MRGTILGAVAPPLPFDELDGPGPPVVLLHGILARPDDWAPVARRLHSAGRRVLVPHLRGHGRAPWTERMSWRPQDDAADVATLLREVAPGGAHLVGHSRGGTTAGWIAAEAPALARSLAVVCSPPQASEAFRAHFRRLLPTAKDERARAALRYLAAIPDDDFPTHALRSYEGPALVVEAGDDPLYSPTHTLFWRAFLPYASFERIDGGHEAFRGEAGAAWLAARLLAHAP